MFDKNIPYTRSKQLGMAMAENTPTASFLSKIGKMHSAGCHLGRIARVARGESTDSLAAETHDDIKVQAAKGWQR